MTPERLAEIKRPAETKTEQDLWRFFIYAPQYLCEMVAEVERLRAEVERLGGVAS
jgi:hypothetical protein